MSEGPRANPPIAGQLAGLYAQLRQVAQRVMNREAAGNTLQATALVHEAYLRLAGSEHLDLSQRPQAIALVARVMRQVLVDHAREKHAEKRGGDVLRVTLEERSAGSYGMDFDMIALDAALQRLAELDEQQVRIIELRLIGGLSVEETAEVLAISTATVKRDTAMAKAWLYRELNCDPAASAADHSE